MEIEDFRQHTMREGSRQKIEEEWTPLQARVARLVTSMWCELMIGLLVVTSFVMMILEADYGAEVPSWLERINHLFLVVYLIEVALKMYVYRTGFFFGLFNVLDLAVVFLDLIAVGISLFFEDSLPSLSALRIFRMLRLTRGVKVMMQLPQLALIVKGMMNGISAALYGVALLLIILTVWGVVAVQFIHPVNVKVDRKGYYQDCDRCHLAFASVRNSMLTFIQQIIAGDSWGEVTIPIIEESPSTSFFFAIVFITVHFTIMNVILAVIVDTALRGSQQDVGEVLKHKLERYKIAEKHLLDICSEMDQDGSGDLTVTEIIRGFEQQKDFRDILVSMDVKKDDMKLVFDILDADRSGTVNYEEFITELFRMKKYDPHTMLVFIKHYVSEIRKEVHETLGNGRLSSSTRSVSVLSPHAAHQTSGQSSMGTGAEDHRGGLHSSVTSLGSQLEKGHAHRHGSANSNTASGVDYLGASPMRQTEEKEQLTCSRTSPQIAFSMPAGAAGQRLEKDNNMSADSASLRELSEQLQSLKQIICDDLLNSMKEMTSKAQRALQEADALNYNVASAGIKGEWVEPRLVSPGGSREAPAANALQRPLNPHPPSGQDRRVDGPQSAWGRFCCNPERRDPLRLDTVKPAHVQDASHAHGQHHGPSVAPPGSATAQRAYR